MNMTDVDRCGGGELRVMVVNRDWRLHPDCGEDDAAWRFVEERVLPMNRNVHVECTAKSMSGWKHRYDLIRELTDCVGSTPWDLVVVDTVTTLSRDAAATYQFLQELRDRNIRFVAVADGIDTGSDGPPLNAAFSFE